MEINDHFYFPNVFQRRLLPRENKQSAITTTTITKTLLELIDTFFNAFCAKDLLSKIMTENDLENIVHILIHLNLII